VAIILSPSWANVPGYPVKHLRRLNASHVVLSHFNNAFEEDFDRVLSLAGKDLVDMGELLREVQQSYASASGAYPRFCKVHLPAITEFPERGRSRNVIRLQP